MATMPVIKPAKGIIKAYMSLCGFRGWTSFWNVIYMMPGYENNERLIKHEMKHIEQIEREGRIKFFIKYTFFLIKYGYKNCPYEVEARQAELQ